MTTEYAPARWNIPDDFLSYEHYVRSVESLEWQSSPGYPYLFEGPTNEAYFRKLDPLQYTHRLNQMWQLVKDRLENMEADPIRLFVKGEPLKRAKLTAGKARLIASVSLADQIIDTMLFGPMNDLLIEKCLEIPSKAGWTPLKGGWKFVPASPWIAIDKSTWDWSVCIWMLDLELELRSKLCNNINEKWLKLAYKRYELLFVNPHFITSGGLLLRQKKPGVMKSGCKNTIATNSICQVILHAWVSLQLNIPYTSIWAMGDDTLQYPIENIQAYLDILSQYCYVKHSKLVNEFAGCRFKGYNVEPLYRGKHAYMLLHMNPKYGQEIATSYMLNYHRSNARDWMEHFFKSLGYSVPDKEICDILYDGE